MVQTSGGGSGVFNLLQVSLAAFLVFFPKDLLPDPLIICLIKSQLSLAQCAKLTGLWGGPLRSPLGGVGKRAVFQLLTVYGQSPKTGANGATPELPQSTPSGGEDTSLSDGGDKICGLGETPCMTGSSYKKLLLIRGLGGLP